MSKSRLCTKIPCDTDTVADTVTAFQYLSCLKHTLYHCFHPLRYFRCYIFAGRVEFCLPGNNIIPPNQDPYFSQHVRIAEGAGEHALDEKARFYRMAKRSATECASILDVCKQLQLIDGNQHSRGRELLLRIAAMLTKMSRISGR